MNNDLISRDALIKAVEDLYEYAELGEVIEVIKNAPAIEYTFEAAFQKTVCENKLYCSESPRGKWFDFIENGTLKARNGDYVLYKIDYLLKNLPKEIYLLEGLRRMKGGNK